MFSWLSLLDVWGEHIRVIRVIFMIHASRLSETGNDKNMMQYHMGNGHGSVVFDALNGICEVAATG